MEWIIRLDKCLDSAAPFKARHKLLLLKKMLIDLCDVVTDHCQHAGGSREDTIGWTETRSK